MRLGLSAGVLAVLVSGLMCVSASGQATPDTSFAETSQASAAQYTDPSPATNPANQPGSRSGPAGRSNALPPARGGLAFTGLDLTVVMLLGASLVTAGLLIRAGSRKTQRKGSSA